MPPLASLGLRYDGHASLQILDQTALPDREDWLDGSDPALMVEHIRLLRVRGAPMIGVCAALALACSAARGTGTGELRAQAQALRAARPTAVNLGWAVDRLLGVLEAHGVAAIPAAAGAIFQEDVALCDRLTEHGAALMPQGARVLTHCNTGGLATAGVGTALGVIRRAHELGRLAQVWVDETRPLLQGGRLTAWELGTLGIPYRLITDSMAGMLMARGEVDAVLVGSDRIAANGDFANKIGTYSVAVLARYHGVPLYVVAPWSTVDRDCPDGPGIPIEERPAHEVRGLYSGLRWAPADAPVYNPAFDVTPAELVTAWVLDSGVLTREEVAAGALRQGGILQARRANIPPLTEFP